MMPLQKQEYQLRGLKYQVMPSSMAIGILTPLEVIIINRVVFHNTLDMLQGSVMSMEGKLILQVELHILLQLQEKQEKELDYKLIKKVKVMNSMQQLM